ncbi:MAG: hypothetical protein JXQ75_13755 [Phycisphaerae bacterium]|nr:hypothetical protein [Phycisphaerae bacterium]
MIQSDDGEGRPEEACLHGSEHHVLKDAIVAVLMSEVGGTEPEACRTGR